MKCARHLSSYAFYAIVHEWVASSKFSELKGSSSYRIGPSELQVVMYFGDSASDVTGISGLNSVSEGKSTLFKTCRGPTPIHPSWYELPLGTFRSGNLSVHQAVMKNTIQALQSA